MLYRTLVRLIELGNSDGMAEKIDIFYAAGKLTAQEYESLATMLTQ